MTALQRAIVFSATALALVVLGAGGAWWWLQSRAAARELVYVIPPGTVDRLAAGETIEVLPGTINLTLGAQDTLVIRNEDAQTVTIGPYVLQPGQQYTQRFYNPGSFEMVCSVHPSSQLRIIVRR